MKRPDVMHEMRVQGHLLFRYGYTTDGRVAVETKCSRGGAPHRGACHEVHLSILDPSTFAALIVSM